MTTSWKQAVKDAIERYSRRHKTVQIDRGKLLAEEQARMVATTSSVGRTPAQTISRILQELRDDGFLFFSSSGRYTINDKNFDVLSEDAPDDALEHAAAKGRLILSDVSATDVAGQARIRRGVAALRYATLANYAHSCALCDIRETPLLVTSHVARWADRPEARGMLSNTICFCRFHDSLFENGFFSLDDRYRIVRRSGIRSRCILTWLDTCTFAFRTPTIAPSPNYLREHRDRTGLSLKSGIG